MVGFIFSSTVFGANKLVRGGNHGVRRNAMFLSSVAVCICWMIDGYVTDFGINLLLGVRKTAIASSGPKKINLT